MILPDVLAPALRVVFCGTAAGSKSARASAYYAGPGNAFWRTLHEIGVTPRELKPGEYEELLRYGVGLTDLCKVSAGSDREVGTTGFDVDRLVATLDEFRPDCLAFNGKRAAEAALTRSVKYGPQPERLGPSRVFVLPSSSAAARRYWDARHWQELAAAL